MNNLLEKIENISLVRKYVETERGVNHVGIGGTPNPMSQESITVQLMSSILELKDGVIVSIIDTCGKGS